MATSIEDEITALPTAFGMDPQSLGIYITVAATVGFAARYVWVNHLSGRLTGYGRGAPGFITSGVRKAWVPNPNPGRVIIEEDHRHIYQPGSSASTTATEQQAPTHTTFSYRDRLAKEKEDAAAGKGKKAVNANVDEEWLPQGIKNGGGGKKGKGRK